MKQLFIMILSVILVSSFDGYSQETGNPAPGFEVNLQGGGTFKLEDQQGKVVVIFFFGNTCPSCQSIGPTVEASIYQAFNDNDTFTAIGLDTWDASSNESSVTGFRNITGITFPLALKAGSVAADYGTTYDRLAVVDAGGILIHNGQVPASNDIENTVDAIMESLASTGADRTGEDPILVFPNPAGISIRINPGGNAVTGFRLYTVSGTVVHEAEFNGHSATAPEVLLPDLSTGIYLYDIFLEGGSHISGKLFIRPPGYGR
jgi:peroxiredoxin